MFRSALIGFAILITSLVAFAQDGAERPHFDKVAIRPADMQTPIGGAVAYNGEQPGMASFRRMPLPDLVRWAYGVEYYQVVTPTGPTRFYDLDAVYPPETPPARVKRMAQVFLEDQLKLQVHREKRDLSVYTLSVANGGPLMRKIQASTQAPDQIKTHWMSKTEQHFEGQMAAPFLVQVLSPMLDHPLVDKTDLAGEWFVSLTYPINEQTRTPDRASLSAAVEKQLGLKLEPAVLPIEMVVVDHVEPPPAVEK